MAVLVCLLVAAPSLSGQDVRSRVEQVLSSPQSSGGPVAEQLVQLGTSAAPVIAEHLDTYRFPMVLLVALGQIRDQSATPAVLAYVNRACLDPQRQEECLTGLAVLRTLEDRRAEAPLHIMMSDVTIQLTTRLVAASALAKWGSPSVREEASALIIHAARNWRTEITSRGDVLDDALAALGTEESQAALIARLQSVSLAAEQARIIRLLAQQPTAQVASSLLAFCERGDRDGYVRLRAAQALVESAMDFPRERVAAAIEQLNKILPRELQPQAERLRSRLAR